MRGCRHVGLSDDLIEAIIAGDRPEFETAQEAVAFDFTRQLGLRNRVDDATYKRAVDELGEPGLMDMVMLIGLYLTVCAIVNVFDVPPPAGPQAVAAPKGTR
jgi:4-carboxymuconolactone decarboxylase